MKGSGEMSASFASIDQLWQRIETSLQVKAPQVLAQLAPGATEQAIRHLESIVNVSLPDDFRASYRLHEGGLSLDPVTYMETLSLEGIAKEWRILEVLLHDESWATQPPHYFTDEYVRRFGQRTDAIQPVWWHHRWIPFASDNAGNLTCLDLAPAAGGTVGQIIDWDHECGPSKVLFPSFQQLLSAFADELENGSTKYPA